MNIRFIVDSASDLSGKEHEALTVLPLTVTFGDTQYLDGVTLSAKEFYEKLIESDELPTTSQVAPYDFEKAIREALEAGETPIVVTVTSKLSGTYNSARLAAMEFDEKVYLVDSENVCVGEQILVKYGLRLLDEGKSAEEIVEAMEAAKKKIRVVALLDTLEYLRKGGRISNVAGFVGGMLSIRPVIGIVDGIVEVLGKARGSKAANNLLAQQIEAAGGIDYDMPYELAYSGLDDSLLRKYINDNEHVWRGHADELKYGIVGSTIGTHAGPGAVAVAFFSV